MIYSVPYSGRDGCRSKAVSQVFRSSGLLLLGMQPRVHNGSCQRHAPSQPLGLEDRLNAGFAFAFMMLDIQPDIVAGSAAGLQHPVVRAMQMLLSPSQV